jgi:hypothetical protein
VQSAQIRRVGLGPLVTFSFKYRSLGKCFQPWQYFEKLITDCPDLLKANGIAPPTQRPEKRKASGTPEPESTDKEANTDAEAAAKLRVSFVDEFIGRNLIRRAWFRNDWIFLLRSEPRKIQRLSKRN